VSSRAAVAGLIVAFLSCAAIAGCGGSDSGDDSTTTPLSGTDIQHLTCTDWANADEAGRDEIVAGLRAILGGQVTGRKASGQGSVLDDDVAHHLFDGYCDQTFARAFSLYKLYGQASGFAGEAP
jgi:hypothetical protein